MQLMVPRKTCLSKIVFDREQNIFGGTRYLRLMANRLMETLKTAAAYNAGPTAVKSGGVPNYRETKICGTRQTMFEYYKKVDSKR